MTFAEPRTPRRRSRRRTALRALVTAMATVALGVTAAAPPARAEGAPITLSRLAAGDRFATAATIATTTFGTATTVFLARGDDPNGFADALAANYPAGHLDAPVLLTNPTQLPPATADALTALGAQSVTILGGTGAIAPAVESALSDRGLTVNRVGGGDRFATAAAIAMPGGQGAVGLNENGLRTAVLSSGRSFPDALAAGGLVWAKHLPQLLTEPQSLPPSTAVAFQNLGIQHVIITGGTGVIADAVKNQVEALGITTERISGDTRYATAVALANKAVASFGFSQTHVEIATGDSFPDALAGGGHAGRALAPTLLVPKTTTHPAPCGYLNAHAGLVDGHVLGGTGAVSDAVLTALGQRCPAAPPVGDLTVAGHGWGHGRGLGQFGAQGYAVDGWSSAQILDHFYGNSTAGTIGGRAIRVRLTAFDNQSPRVTSADPFTAGGQNVPGGGSAWITDEGTGWTVHVAATGGCGGAETSSAPATIPVPQAWPVFAGNPNPGNNVGSMLAVCDGGGAGVTRSYRGGFEQARDSEGPPRFVNVVGLEEYLRGVVPRESPSGWNAAALEAQAVAARSYAAAEDRYSYAETCDTTTCQVYGGAGVGGDRVEADSTDAAIAATVNRVRLMNGSGAVARTEFSSSTGGHTAGGTFASVPDDGDDIASNPNHNWSAPLDPAAVAARYGVGTVLSVDVTARTQADGQRRASQVTITGTDGTVERSGEQFRSDWSLKSTWFSIQG